MTRRSRARPAGPGRPYGRGLSGWPRLAGLLQRRGPPHDLGRVGLEEQLAAAARAERLLSGVPDGRRRTGQVGVGGPELLRGRTPRLRRDEHLAGAVAAEIAVKLGSKHRWPPDLV